MVDCSKIDIALVAGRRPDLLERTLNSFRESMFHHFDIHRVLVNIDPFAGNIQDHGRAVAIIRNHFPNAEINEPESASFGMAVKTLWSSTTADMLIHLEDDWLLLEDVTPSHVYESVDENVPQLSLLSKEKNWTPSRPYYYKTAKRKIFGATISRKKIPLFGTSPSFLLGSFARSCADLMDPDLDPEKQFFSGSNPELEKHVQDKKVRILAGESGKPIIKDIGREWLEKRNVEKVVRGSKSFWVPITKKSD